MEPINSVSLEDTDDSLGARILSEIKNGTYTCLVCTEEIDQQSRVWSCKMCYRVYDLDCIKGWAKKDSKGGEEWRCPSCNGKSSRIPKTYGCWCGKTVNPIENPFQPHSCGQTCSKKLAGCPHSCPLTCHPGPHAETCLALPRIKCQCGKHSKQFPCVIAPYETGWKCDTVCNEQMACMKHRHNDTCHAGLCGDCQEPVDARCYCGKHSAKIPCYQDVPLECGSAGDAWTGRYQCDSGRCDILLDCGVHRCEVAYCHVKGHECELNPARITRCPCGQTAITELLGGENRQSCQDPVPTCDKVCGKLLACGHKCYWKCHEGSEHARCYEVIDMECGCGFSRFTVPCKFVQEGQQPKCRRKCQALKNCRRHRCGNVCCAFEKQAIQRERNNKRNNRTGQAVDDDFEAVHLCLEPCNKLLSCKQHRCQWQDHPGKCPPCLESSSDDLMCSCGRTTLLEAPVRCGAVPQTRCQHQCQRPTACGHQMPHLCHESDAACPKCTATVTRTCRCTKRDIKGVYCYQKDVSCGIKCDRLLACGHECSRACCAVSDNHLTIGCQSSCNKPRANCDHKDTLPCHWPKPCNNNVPCKHLVGLKCPCGRITKQVECAASSTAASRASEILECNAECARIKRNNQLMAALNIQAGQNPSSPYSDYILSVYARQSTWCGQIEDIFQQLVGDWLANPNSKRTHRFPSMKVSQRTFVHHLSDIYNLQSQSQDPEPNRSVFVEITATSCLPEITLAQLVVSLESIAEYNALLVDQEPVEIAGCTAKSVGDNQYLIIPQDYQTLTSKSQQQLVDLGKSLASAKLCKVDFNGETILKYGTVIGKVAA